jgi:hypothetical protein
MMAKARAMLLALSLAALPFAVACGRDEQPATVDTPPASETTTPAAVRVTQVELGNAIGTDKRVTAATTEFRPSDTIYATVVTEGTAPNATLVARWTFEDGQTVEESTQTITPSGTAVSEFHVSKPTGWPVGKYRVEILVNGVSAETKEFEVKT